MLNTILHPIRTTRVIRQIATQITPKDKAEFEAAKTKDEKAEIALQIVSKSFPELAYLTEESA